MTKTDKNKTARINKNGKLHGLTEKQRQKTMKQDKDHEIRRDCKNL